MATLPSEVFLKAGWLIRREDRISKVCNPSFQDMSTCKGVLAGDQLPGICYLDHGAQTPRSWGQPMEFMTHLAVSGRLAGLHWAQINGIKPLPVLPGAGPQPARLGGDMRQRGSRVLAGSMGVSKEGTRCRRKFNIVFRREISFSIGLE